MAEVKNIKNLWKVEIREYERGWGQRDMGTKLFDNEQEAKSFCIQYNKDGMGDTECYFRADYYKVV